MVKAPQALVGLGQVAVQGGEVDMPREALLEPVMHLHFALSMVSSGDEQKTLPE